MLMDMLVIWFMKKFQKNILSKQAKNEGREVYVEFSKG